MSVQALQIPQSETAPVGELLVLFASQTGNGETVAESLAGSLSAMGLRVSLKSMSDIRPAQLKKQGHVAIVISTHGDGDPPDDALDVFDWLKTGSSSVLSNLTYRILALGDRSYTEFCAAAHELDSLLKKRGATAFGSMIECDVEYEEPAKKWSEQVIEWGQDYLGTAAANETLDVGAPTLAPVVSGIEWSRSRPFPALVERVQKITGQGSDKEVFHIELSLQGSGLHYEPGDSLGIWAENDAESVSAVLKKLGINPATPIEDQGQLRPIREVLTRHREITRLNPELLEQWAIRESRNGKGRLARHLAQLDADQRKQFMEARQLIDLAMAYPLMIEAQELADWLSPLTSRTYSIASSRSAVDEDVHLTVVTLNSNAIGEQRSGAVSSHLNEKIRPGDELRVFMEPNRRFRLPEDNDKPVIMVAAGTGIAPFRAFMQELEDREHEAGSWLIFGNPHKRTDFLYQRDWLHWRARGHLSRIDLAFSRDQQEKRYVQHVVRERALEVNRWIESGAVIYICGAIAMGHAVEEALVESIAQARGISQASALDVVKDLRRERRLLKDLY